MCLQIEVGSFNHPSSQVPIESLGNILDRLNMSEQPSTSRTMSFDTTTIEIPTTIPTMFAGIPSILASYQVTNWSPLRGCFDDMVCSYLFTWNPIWYFLC